MVPRWVTFAYLVYLALPMALLFIGSFGDLWLNSLLPTGVTVKWYLQVAADPSFRRAFIASLFVAVMTSIVCVVIGLPLAYAVFRAHDQRVRAAARVLYQLPVALPALVVIVSSPVYFPGTEGLKLTWISQLAPPCSSAPQLPS